MDYRVVTIARSIGAGGEEIGRSLAGALGFRHVDDEIILRAAQKAGVSPDAVERAEQRRPLLVRMLEAMVTALPTDASEWTPEVVALAPPSASYQAFIAEAITETAEEGNVVIVAHGGAVPLAGRSDALRVLVTASPTVRSERLRETADLDERRAAETVRESDKARADFLRRFYGVHEEQATMYDLVVNTDRISPAQAVATILTALKS